jgi:hypothetical protein
VIVVVTNSIQPAFTGISSFFFVTNQKITLAIGLVDVRAKAEKGGAQSQYESGRGVDKGSLDVPEDEVEAV